MSDVTTSTNVENNSKPGPSRRGRYRGNRGSKATQHNENAPERPEAFMPDASSSTPQNKPKRNPRPPRQMKAQTQANTDNMPTTSNVDGPFDGQRPQQSRRGRGSFRQFRSSRGGHSAPEFNNSEAKRTTSESRNEPQLSTHGINDPLPPRDRLQSRRGIGNSARGGRQPATNQALEQNDSSAQPTKFQGFNPNAPTFVPKTAQKNQSNRHEKTNKNPLPRRNQRVANDNSKYSSNLTMRELLTNRLLDEDYECAICCQALKARDGIWSCKKCYQMFHITHGCIVTWAKKSREEDNRWRCPYCQTKYETIPYNYYCFCGKERNPTYTRGDVPHSCGGICGGSRGPGCPHPCTEPCHPGACAECPVMITKKCSCGSTAKAVRCGTSVTITCDNVCDRALNCGKHKCTQKCHDGPCQPCEEILTQVCQCGQSSHEVLCAPNTRASEKFSCGKPCTGLYSCGIHECENSCHPNQCGPCPSDVNRVNHCPCGRQLLASMGVSRKVCTDPIPTCDGICNKYLLCGSSAKPHRCRQKCHSGPCPPCDYNTSVICRCGQVKKNLPCQEYVDLVVAADGEFLCEKRCRKKKSCGIHKCQEMCCIQDEHICMQICNKRLSCGIHFCENICHTGPCGRCLHASFEEQFCHCGRTVRMPPIPCGSPLPECSEPCARLHPCGHAPNHGCHSDSVCPPCTHLVDRECYGKHEVRKNIPCHIEAVSCGRDCGVPLSCGVHTCHRRCHSGSCLPEGTKCTQPCPKLRTCEHPCALPCHSTTECPESPCRTMVTVMCECGRRTEQLKCEDVEKEMNRLHACKIAERLETSESLSEGSLKRSPSLEKLTCLSCNDKCKKVARNKRIAEALSIVTDEEGNSEGGPTITFTETMKSFWRTQPQFVLGLEKFFHDILTILADVTLSNNSCSKHLPPMPMERRRLIHEYATYFHLDSQSVDPAPKRSVIVTGRRGISRPPLVLLSELQKYPGILKSIGPVTLRSGIDDDAQKHVSATEVEGLRQIKEERKVYKRMPPKIATVAPLKQKNMFALLGSDDEDECSSRHSEPVQQTAPNIHLHEKDVNWWSDEEDIGQGSTRTTSNKADLVEADVDSLVSELIDTVLHNIE